MMPGASVRAFPAMSPGAPSERRILELLQSGEFWSSPNDADPEAFVQAPSVR